MLQLCSFTDVSLPMVRIVTTVPQVLVVSKGINGAAFQNTKS